MYGDTPATRQAWALNERLFNQREEKLRKELRDELAREQAEAAQAQRETDFELAETIADIEDRYSVDLSSNSAVARKNRADYLKALEDISPKDADGDPVSFGDADAAYRLWQLERKGNASTERAKEASGRSMSPSSPASQGQGKEDPVRAYLRANGIKV